VKALLRGLELIAALVISAAAAYLVLVADPLDRLDAARERHLALRQQYLDASWKLANLDILRQQLATMKQRQQAIRKILPDADGLIVGREALEHSIRAALPPRLAPSLELAMGNSVMRDFYAYRPFSIRVSGDFSDIVQFLQRVSSGSERLRIVRQLSMKPRSPGTGVTLVAEVYAFAYLTEDAMAALRKAQSQDDEGKKR
jgi:type IV pilus assembly protein PilO